MWYIIYKTNEEVLTMRKELLKGLSEEQIKKVEECKSSEEILALAKAEGMELTDEQLEAVSGGGCLKKTFKCKKCGAKDKYIKVIDEDREYNKGAGGGGFVTRTYKCTKCGYEWEEDTSFA